MRNTIAQVWIHSYAKLIQSDNGKEFTNKILNTYLAEKEVKYLYGLPYHPQSQGEIEDINKTVQISLSTVYDNAKNEKINKDLKINLFHLLLSIIVKENIQQLVKF